jgi:hypothetical protein
LSPAWARQTLAQKQNKTKEKPTFMEVFSFLFLKVWFSWGL